jgi:hypothetical protein
MALVGYFLIRKKRSPVTDMNQPTSSQAEFLPAELGEQIAPWHTRELEVPPTELSADQCRLSNKSVVIKPISQLGIIRPASQLEI